MSFATAPGRVCPLCQGVHIRPWRAVSRKYAGARYSLQLRRCADCQFVFLPDPPAIHYDEDYLYLEGVVTTDALLSTFRAQERIAKIAGWVPPGAASAFLDIGIGDGLLLSVAEAAGYTTFGYDVNPAGAKMARDHYGLRAELCCAADIQAAFPGRRFDVIHMNEVIEHIPEPMPLLLWCRERLAPDGRLVIQTGNLDSLASRLKGADWDYFRPVHVSYFSARTLSAGLSRAGFRVVSHATADWRPASVIKAARRLRRVRGMAPAARLLFLYATALLPGVRRTVVVSAT